MLENHVPNSVANPGLIRPPIIFASAIAMGILLNLIFPVMLSFGYSAKLAACGFLLGGAFLFLWTRSEFRKARTPISGNLPATSLLQNGPFRFSRNPMYLAFAAFHISIAFWSENLWVFGTLVIALFVISKVVVPREERFMQGKFGAQYQAYAVKTRRWI